jgi:hypothetical protein
MTRYEMAAITARAMAKADKADAASKATIDKLAVEFSKELNDLGVRVAKLEKNQSSFNWTGDYRMRWVDADKVDGDTSTQHRLRIAANAQVNENTSVYMRVMAFDHTDLGKWASGDGKDMDIVDINATIKNFAGIGDLTLGRYSHKLGTIGYFLDSTGKFDGAKLAIPMGDVKLTAAFADADLEFGTGTSTEITTAQADWAASKNLTLSAYYGNVASTDSDLLGFGAKYAFAKDWTLAGDFMTLEDSKWDGKDADNLHVRLSYKGANKSVVGSWGAWVEYADFESEALDTGASINSVDFKEFYGIGVSNTLAKNVVFNAYYYDFDKIAGVKPASGKDYTRAEVNFYF